MRAIIFAGLVSAAGCGHVAPATSEGVPPPWPAADAPVVSKSAPAPIEAEPRGKTVVPPLKPELVPPPTTPNTPQ